ncbi:Pca regulon regulatory protein (plasmid) [Antarctobacter heliothermus]|uniref:Pca regulon regulatory protein n=1 Tax=Antarctobacter heliothermus TaxID=74033 RepID=A0A222EBI7_9RHOB|nr:IclR family transcriptional regulator [Antarctobacter heliothermus]ASP23555.1 Pca regulon regulatory protein [Antarctobacter heliothermus]
MSHAAGDTSSGRTGGGLHNVKSVEKAFAVLEAFRDVGRSLSLSELVTLSGLDKSAVQRFTRTLRDVGYLRQNPKTRQYELSAKVLDLSYSYLNSSELVARAAPGLIKLRNTTNERVDLSFVDDTTLIYLFRIQSKQETISAALIGRRVPIYCTAGGRAVLARMPEDQARALLDRSELTAHTARTLTDPDAIMEDVRKVRDRGFAVQADEWRIGEVVAAAAIVNHSGEPVGALHIVGNTGEWTPEDFGRRMGSLVAIAAQDASL